MDLKPFNTGLLAFLQASPTPFHAVAALAAALDAGGFVRLREAEPWDLRAGGRYYTTRNGSSLIAFVKGKASVGECGLRLVGAHTDSPRLIVKPRPERVGGGYFQLGVEVYGGALLHPWFDRDLSIAGRVVFQRAVDGPLEQALIDFERPVATIPSLAIHLDRDANQGHSVNAQTDIVPLLFSLGGDPPRDLSALLAARLAAQVGTVEGGGIRVLDHELSLYDTQPPAMVGLHEDFIASARLDNLLSCYCGVQALLEAKDEVTSVLVCTDHEEVGSHSACGAAGPMLDSSLQRIIADPQERIRALSRSLLVSADNAHGVHPNFAVKHEPNHGPLLNGGPVLKVNNNQRYATNSVSAALFRRWCEREGVPLQVFVTRSDLGCGSTIGPITATAVGVTTLDVGVPTFAMHSIRELAGATDAHALFRVLRTFYRHAEALAIA